MWSFYDNDDYYEEFIENLNEDSTLTFSQKICNHSWTSTILVISTVYDCSKCNVKKEIYEKWLIEKK